MYNFLLTASSAIDEKTLVHLEQLNDICWQLANDSQGMMVTQILPTFLPKLTYSDLHQPEDAWEALMQVDGMQPKLPVIESTRIEFLNLQAKTAALAGNMELSREYLIASVKLAKNNGYAIWAEEAYDVYMTLCQIWPHEKQIKSLVTLFQ
jgi:hypothetical protein